MKVTVVPGQRITDRNGKVCVVVDKYAPRQTLCWFFTPTTDNETLLAIVSGDFNNVLYPKVPFNKTAYSLCPAEEYDEEENEFGLISP